MAKRGRPTKLTPSVVKELLERLAAGESLNRICRDKHMPTAPCIRNHLLDDSEFFAKYARARDMGLDAMADETLDIADDGRNDTFLDDEGNEKVDHDHIKRSALRVDARKWYLSKLAPKKYGNNVNHEVGGKDGGEIIVRLARPEELSAEDREASGRGE